MNSARFFLISLLFCFSVLSSAQDQCSVFGWANLKGQTYVGPVTGGGNSTPIEVTTFAELKTAAESSDPKVIYIKNSVGDGYKGTTGDVLNIKSNKTVIGYPGVTVKCSWQINGVSNIIIRNLTLQGPGYSNSEQNWDVVALYGATRVWVDHCMVLDGEDGNLDISKGSDNVSVTWCVFTYSADGVHNLSNLIGGSDNEPISHGKLNVTFANCWWKNVNSRTPRTRYGMIHILNCYYSNSPGPTCGFMSNMRVEGVYFDRISNPIGLISDGGLAGSFPIDCYFDNCTGNTTALSKGGYTVFTPPYPYSVTPAADVKAMVTNPTCGAGPTMLSPVECACTFSDVPVNGITLSPESKILKIGQSFQISATIIPFNASNKRVTWNSANNAVATVSSSGILTGVSKGTAIITATTEDGAKTANCDVSVVFSALPLPLIKLDFDENTGAVISNQGSVSVSFTKTEIPEWSDNIPANHGISALDFGTSTGNYYVESTAIPAQLANLTNFTISGWVNCRNATVGSGGNRIVSWINNGGNGVDVVYMSDGSLKLGVNEWPDKTTAISSTGKISTDANAGPDNWKFFAITYQSTTGKTEFYFGDNITPASRDKSYTYSKGAVGANIGKLAVGHFNSESSRTSRTDRMFKGLIDQIQVFSSELTVEEIQLIQKADGANGTSDLNQDPGFLCYPNPVINNLTIELKDKLSVNSQVQVIDVTGSTLIHKKSCNDVIRLNMSALSSGIYMVKVSGSTHSIVKCIIKK